MKKTFRYALSAVIGAALVVPAFAQDNFPDVPANHWAYEALARLKKDGLLVGYPDGLYRGGRPASRYELAVAIHAVYTALLNRVEGLENQLKGINTNGLASADDLKNLRDQVAALQDQVNGMKGYGDDIANLKRLTDTFQKELNSLGVDVEAMKKDLADLADRVGRLERRKPAVDISGDVNLWLGAGNSRDNLFDLTKDARVVGSTATGGPAGLTRDVTILHEGAITLTGTNETGPKWHGTFVATNMFANSGPGNGFGNQSGIISGVGYGEPDGDFYVQDLGIRFDTGVAGQAFNVEAGRVGYKVSPYIYQRPDTTEYFSNSRWDDGLYRFDGAILGFNFGGAKLDIFGGKPSHTFSVNGTPINTLDVGNTWISSLNNLGGTPVSIDRQLGAALNVPLTTAGNLKLAYIWLETDTEDLAFNRMNVYGADADFNVGRIKLSGGWSATTVGYNTSTVGNTDKDNNAWYAKLGWNGDRYGAYAEYRRIEDNYLAPGDWGRLAVVRNPGNIQGAKVGGNLDLTGALRLTASGEWDKGIKDNANNPYFNSGTNLQQYMVNLGWQFNPNLSFNVGYEHNRIDGQNQFGGHWARYDWTSVGLAYGLSSAAKLTLQYEISDVSGNFLDNPAAGIAGGGLGTDYRGGFLTSQLSVKF